MDKALFDCILLVIHPLAIREHDEWFRMWLNRSAGLLLHQPLTLEPSRLQDLVPLRSLSHVSQIL